MNYLVTYTTATGNYELPSMTLKEAKQDVQRLKALNKQPGHLAAGIRIVKVS